MLGLTRYQWIVLFTAWLGWGFDLFDSILFNFVAPNCVPTLLHLPIGSPEARQATLYWTGILTSLLLLGWAAGGVLFGHIGDRIGRTRTMLLTILLYALGTAACAFAPNIWALLAFRVVASLGIGGEWAAGAAMVAEAMPEDRRVEGGALLYTSAAFGTTLATLLNLQIAGHWFADRPEVSWRYVFLCGLIPAAVAFGVRLFVHEPERWTHAARNAAAPHLRELFSPQLRRVTLSGFLMALTALIAWWSCNAFLPTFATGLAQVEAALQGYDRSATLKLVEDWKFTATMAFNVGGLIGTLLTIPAAKRLGRKPMFAIYFAASASAIFFTFGAPLAAHTRLYGYFLIGLSVFGVFGSFTYYLPELFPTRLRATGAGFCYNIGRVIAAAGPFLVGLYGSRVAGGAIGVLFWIGVVPLLGLLLMPLVVETRGRALVD
ncbi:MAG: MFS transporter [Solimonas sp.]